MRQDVVFHENSFWSSNAELQRRSLSPLKKVELAHDLAELAKQHKVLAEQPLVPEDERFILYVPPEMPAGGYNLLVFVMPWDQQRMPPGWDHVLDLFGTIYVSAARSGNDQDILARREPLALMAAGAVQKLYKVNPDHVFIGGLSGGSRVAERIALGYPDLFRGAILNAGSDRIGDRKLALPPADLLRKFQEDSRIVFMTGEQDDVNLVLDRDTMISFDENCIYGVTSQPIHLLGHAMAPPGALKEALRWLLNPRSLNQDMLKSCRAKLDGEVRQSLDKVKALKAKGDEPAAHAALEEIDLRFGGLADPEATELARSPGE